MFYLLDDLFENPLVLNHFGGSVISQFVLTIFVLPYFGAFSNIDTMQVFIPDGFRKSCIFLNYDFKKIFV